MMVSDPETLRIILVQNNDNFILIVVLKLTFPKNKKIVLDFLLGLKSCTFFKNKKHINYGANENVNTTYMCAISWPLKMM